MVIDNVKYGGVGLRVVQRISLRKLHHLLRFTVHFVKFSDSENELLRRELRRITIGVD